MKQVEKFTGRPCPRVELFDANVEVVACVSELRALGDSPAACDDAYQDGTEGLDREERREFRRKMGIYRNRLERLLRENSDHRATAKAGNPTKGRRRSKKMIPLSQLGPQGKRG